MMLQSNYLICFDGVALVPRLLLLLVLDKKLKKDFKKEKIGDSKRRARSLDRSPVIGAKSGSKASQMVPKMKPIAGKKKAKNGVIHGYQFVSLRDSTFSFC